MLTLSAGQVECLWDEALPVQVKELPEDLAALDRLLSDPGLLGPVVERFRREVVEEKRAVLTDGRPTIAMETFIRLMVLKARYRWGINGRWWRRVRIRFTCGGSAGSRWWSGCRTSRRSASLPAGSAPRRCRR